MPVDDPPPPSSTASFGDRAEVIGEWSVEFRSALPSTNAEAARDPRPGRVVVADEQTAGRGRLGRTWSTPRGLALAASAVVPDPGEGLRGWVPLVTGLALRAAVRRVTGVTPGLKWPNDLLATHGPEDGRKLAGILCELTPRGIVVGVGLNLGQDRARLPVPTATSLALLGVDAARDPLASGLRDQLLRAHLNALAARLRQLVDTPYQVQEDYRRACVTLGREVAVHEPTRLVRGVAVDVDADGRLELRTPSGPYAVAAGDVVHVRPSA